MGQETSLMKKQMIALSSLGDVTVFRNNVGTGWQGKVLKHDSGMIILQNPRIVHFGLCEGSSDIIGLKRVVITEDMVGKEVAIFVAIESKTKTGKVSPEQENFINFVNKSGGIAGIARSEDEATSIANNL